MVLFFVKRKSWFYLQMLCQMCSFQHQLQRQEGPVKKQIQVFNVFLQGKMKQIIEFDKKKKISGRKTKKVTYLLCVSRKSNQLRIAHSSV